MIIPALDPNGKRAFAGHAWVRPREISGDLTPTLEINLDNRGNKETTLNRPPDKRSQPTPLQSPSIELIR